MAKRSKTPSKWTWRPGGPEPAVEAEVFAAELERLADGDPLSMVEPGAIVEAARPRRSPIHPAFNWNIQEAAEAHWLDHARQLVGRLQLVRVEVQNGPTTSSRAWWSVSIEKRKGYVHENKIMSDQDLRTQTIATAKNELHSYVAKYLSVIGTIGNVVPRLREIIADIQAEIDQLELDANRPKPRRSPPRSSTKEDRVSR